MNKIKKTRKKKPAVIGPSNPLYVLGHGYVALGHGAVGPFGLTTIRAMKVKKELGSEIKDEETHGPETRIIFSTLESVDTFIKNLLKTRKKMIKNGAEIYRVSDRHPDFGQQVPRKRTKR